MILAITSYKLILKIGLRKAYIVMSLLGVFNYRFIQEQWAHPVHGRSGHRLWGEGLHGRNDQGLSRDRVEIPPGRGLILARVHHRQTSKPKPGGSNWSVFHHRDAPNPPSEPRDRPRFPAAPGPRTRAHPRIRRRRLVSRPVGRPLVPRAPRTSRPLASSSPAPRRLRRSTSSIPRVLSIALAPNLHGVADKMG